MNEEQRYQQVVANARRTAGTPAGRAVLDRVLDALIDPMEPILGEQRNVPYGRLVKRRWVSALQVLTERVLGYEIDSTATDQAEHGLYATVAACVIVLEVEGLVKVSRQVDDRPWKANPVYRIEIVV